AVHDAVSRMADEQSVKVALVVILEAVEVRRDDEGRPETPGRHHQEAFSLEFVGGKGLAAHPGDSHGGPFGDRTATVRPFECAGNAFRYPYLEPPVAPRPPSVSGKKIRDRGQRVGHRVPDIRAAIAVEIDGIFHVGGWQELRLAHGTRP